MSFEIAEKYTMKQAFKKGSGGSSIFFLLTLEDTSKDEGPYKYLTFIYRPYSNDPNKLKQTYMSKTRIARDYIYVKPADAGLEKLVTKYLIRSLFKNGAQLSNENHQAFEIQQLTKFYFKFFKELDL